jgi:hypothetical protein
MRKGRPAKRKKRNISGLKNQNASLIPSHDSSPRSTSPGIAPPQPIVTVTDSIRTNWEEEDSAPLDSDLDDQLELDIWDDEDLAEKLEEMLMKADVEDCDWLPPRLQQQKNQRKGECNGPESYIQNL